MLVLHEHVIVHMMFPGINSPKLLFQNSREEMPALLLPRPSGSAHEVKVVKCLITSRHMLSVVSANTGWSIKMTTYKQRLSADLSGNLFNVALLTNVLFHCMLTTFPFWVKVYISPPIVRLIPVHAVQSGLPFFIEIQTSVDIAIWHS